ncbi:MAG: hypothetical protein WCC97_11940 [Candidatus Acidiferrales bacterium]
MTVALHFGREVKSAGLVAGRPKVDSPLEPPGSDVQRECFVFLTGGVAGELLCDPNTPFDSEGAGVDQQMITERGGGDIKEYLEEALAILRSHHKAWATLQYAFLKELRKAQLQSTMGGIVGSGPSRTKILLTGDQIKQIWDANKT